MAFVNVKSANFTYKSVSTLSNNIFIDNKIVNYDDIESFDFASEDNVKKVKSSIGWGVAGAVTFGVFGAAAGLLLGGNKKETTFILSLKSGKALIGSTKPDVFLKIQKAINEHRDYVKTIGDLYIDRTSFYDNYYK
jgi:hypothetical protein